MTFQGRLGLPLPASSPEVGEVSRAPFPPSSLLMVFMGFRLLPRSQLRAVAQLRH